MGVMYTKENHRRKGYAVDVTIDLAHQIIESGKIPFIQIVQGNGMSPGLAKKCGFVEAGKADWFGIIAGNPKELIDANENSRQQFLATIPNEFHGNLYKKNTPYVCLYNFLHNFKYKSSDIDGGSFIKVESEEQKAEWCAVTFDCLVAQNKDISKKEMFFQAVSNSNYNLFLMLKNGIAVAATATLKYEEEDRGIYLLSVRPEYKGDNMVQMLISETVHYEKDNGCYFMATQAEDKLADVFKELGFRESHRI
jgi:hypothetical protein